MDPDPQDAAPPLDPAPLLARITALERELARYAAKYGMTDEARRLFRAERAIGPEGTSMMRRVS